MISIYHIFAIGLEDARISACLGEYLHQGFEIEPHGLAQAQAFGQTCSIDIHHHVNQRFDLGRLAGFADVEQVDAHGIEDGAHFVKNSLLATAHQVEGALARLGDAAGHAAFQGGSPDGAGPFFHL